MRGIMPLFQLTILQLNYLNDEETFFKNKMIMKYIFGILLFFFSVANVFAQKETFDLVTYTVLKGWKKEVKANSYTSYSITNKQKKTYCQIFIMISTASKGGIKEDFDNEWEELIKKPNNKEPQDAGNVVKEIGGWKIKTGRGKFTFNNTQPIAVLSTMSGYNRCVSIVSTTNSLDYMPAIEQLLASVEMKKPAINSQPVVDNNSNNTAILGTWGKGNSVTLAGGSFGRWSYTKAQYIFNQSGAYSFARKVYVEDDVETLLTRETGTYTISGNKIIINPTTNVIEAWSKINGGDNFKQLISSQKKPLEKTTYQFTVQYNTELKDTFLLLIADKETARDGWSNAESIHSPIAWRYGPTPPFTPIKMPN